MSAHSVNLIDFSDPIVSKDDSIKPEPETLKMNASVPDLSLSAISCFRSRVLPPISLQNLDAGQDSKNGVYLRLVHNLVPAIISCRFVIYVVITSQSYF